MIKASLLWQVGLIANVKLHFLHIVTKSIGKMKYTTKFIYQHSSQKETQLSMLRFFWRKVYMVWYGGNCWDL